MFILFVYQFAHLVQALSRIFRYLVFFAVSLLANALNGQSHMPLLDRTITIKAIDQRLDKVLDIISETGGFTFSYSNEVINTKKIVTVMEENRTIRQVLDKLFNGEISYQQIGNHLVLQRVPKIKSAPVNVRTKNNFLISGYIRDEYSGAGISNVSVYHEKQLYSTLSQDFGYYSLPFSSSENLHTIKFSREGYSDTSVQFTFARSGNTNFNLSMSPRHLPGPPPDTVTTPTTDSSVPAVFPVDTLISNTDTGAVKTPLIQVNVKPVLDWLTSTTQKLQAKNIKDTLTRKTQITLFPPLSTNRGMSSVVNNNTSLNIIAGYNGGVNAFEFGGFANIIRNDVRGVQIAGFTNIVGRNVNGTQFAGFMNINEGITKGAQFAGFMNLNEGRVSGGQFAGFMNLNGHGAKGAQFAGFMNLNSGHSEGIQFAGFTNICDSAEGLQAAGFMNIATYSRVTQFAGFANIAGTVDGVQAAGFINVADTVKGLQVGFINIARHSAGASIGFLSFIKNGYHQLEIGTNEIGYNNIAYRSGTSHFYTIIHTGVKPSSLFGSNASMWYYGYGLGTAVKLSPRFDLNIDLTAQHMNKNGHTNYLNELGKFNLSLNYKPSRAISIYAGPSFNMFMSDENNPDYDADYSSIRSKYIQNTSDNGYAWKSWIGFNAGIRFF